MQLASPLSCAPEENSYHGGIRRFWPFLKIIAAKLLVKLELALHSMAWSLPKTPNRNFELSQLFQSNSLNRPQSLCNLGLESPSRLEKCPNRVGEEMAFCVTQKKEKGEICWCKIEEAAAGMFRIQEGERLGFIFYTPYTTTIPIHPFHNRRR